MEIKLKIKNKQKAEGKSLPLLNFSEEWGNGRGTRLWTKYKHNFLIGDYVYIDKGTYKNIPTTWDDYAGPERLSDFLVAYKIIWVDKKGTSLVINKKFIKTSVIDDDNPELDVFISSNPFISGEQIGGVIYDCLIGYSEDQNTDFDYSTPLTDPNYTNKFPYLKDLSVHSGIVINGVLENVDWNGGSVLKIENKIDSNDVFPRVLDPNKEETNLYSIFKKGKFSGVWGAGLCERMIFEDGFFIKGTFKGGLWENGVWEMGIMESFYNRLEVKNIIWKNGIAKNIIWRGGEWWSGEWRGDELYSVIDVSLTTTNDIFLKFEYPRFVSNIEIGDIVVLSDLKYNENPKIKNIDYQPFKVVSKTTLGIVIHSDELDSNDVIESIDLKNVFKVTNSCWNSGYWKTGIWKGGIKSDTSFNVYKIINASPTPNHYFYAFRPYINTFPVHGPKQLNYEFRNTDISIGEKVYSWNLTGASLSQVWEITDTPIGMTNPLSDFYLKLKPLTGTSISGISHSYSPVIIDFSFWENGEWRGGLWLGGIWNEGKWYKGVFRTGIWIKGEWNGGNIDSIFWNEGIFNDGSIKNLINYHIINDVTLLHKNIEIYTTIYNLNYIVGSTIFNDIIFNNGEIYDGLIIKGTVNYIHWKGGNMFSLHWKDGKVYSDMKYERTNYQIGYFLWNRDENWGARIEGITTVSSKINYILANGSKLISFDDDALLHSETNPSKIIAKTFLGVLWENGEFNIEGSTTPSEYTAVWVRGDWKDGFWNNGSWSPLDNVEVYDKETYIHYSSNKYYQSPYLHYPIRQIDYTRGLRHNIFENGIFNNGHWYNGYFMGGTINGGVIDNIYAVANSSDLNVSETIINKKIQKFLIKNIFYDLTDFKMHVEPSLIEIEDDDRTYTDNAINKFVKYDLISVSGLLYEKMIEIRDVRKSNYNDNIIITVDLGTKSPFAIRSGSFIEIRGMINRNTKTPSINGFHYVVKIYNSSNDEVLYPLGVNSGRIHIEITTTYNSQEVLENIDWSKAYIYRGDSQIISDKNTNEFLFNPLGNNYDTNLSVDEVFIDDNGKMVWINATGLLPSVVSEDNQIIYVTAENSIYRNYFSSSIFNIKIEKSILNSAEITDDIESATASIIDAIAINHSYIKKVNTKGCVFVNTFVISGEHDSLISNKTLFRGIDEYGYHNIPIIIKNATIGLNSFVPVGLSDIIFNADTISFIDSPSSSLLGDLIFVRGVFGKYSEAIGGSFSKGHIYIDDGQVKKPSNLIFSTYPYLASDSINDFDFKIKEFHHPYDNDLNQTYSLAYFSENSLDNAIIENSTVYSAVFNKGIFKNSKGINMVIFSSKEIEEINVTSSSVYPYGYVGLATLTKNDDEEIKLELPSSIEFKKEKIYYIDFYEQKYSLFNRYCIFTTDTNELILKDELKSIINELNSTSSISVHIKVTSLRSKDSKELNIINYGSNTTNVWTKTQSIYSIERDTIIRGDIINSIIFKCIYESGVLLSEISDDSTDEMRSVWINGVFENGSLIGQIEFETGEEYPNYEKLSLWWGGFVKGGSLYGVLWTRGKFDGGVFNSGIWESYDVTNTSVEYDETESEFNSGIWRSVIYQKDDNNNSYLKYHPSASIWLGGKWKGRSGFSIGDDEYTNIIDDSDGENILRNEIIRCSWNGPYKEFMVDDQKSVILLGSSSVWLGGKWLRGEFNGGIFFNGEWWSADRDIQGPYPNEESACYGDVPDTITPDNKPYHLSGTLSNNEKSKFIKGAFVASVWEGGIFGSYNSGPMTSTATEVNQIFWKSNEYETIFGWYIPQDRNFIINGNKGYDINSPQNSSIAEWIIDDSPFYFEFEINDSPKNRLEFFKFSYYEPKYLKKELLFGKKMFIPNSYKPTWVEGRGLMENLPQTSYFKRGLFNHGIASWSIFDSLAHITTPIENERKKWDYESVEIHTGEICSDCYLLTGLTIKANQPTLFRQGLIIHSYWNAGIIRNDKITFDRSIWISGSWSDEQSDSDPDYTDEIEFFNPYSSLGILLEITPPSGPAVLGPPNSIPSFDGTFDENDRISWDDVVSSITGNFINYGEPIEYKFIPSYNTLNTNFHKNFFQSIWYSGVWDGGRFQLSVWNSFMPGLDGWGENSLFTYKPFKAKEDSKYSNWVIQFAPSDSRNRFSSEKIERNEIFKGKWPMGYLDIINEQFFDNVLKKEWKSIDENSPKDNTNMSLYAVFDEQKNVSDTQIDGRYKLFELNLLTAGDFQTWVRISDSDGMEPDNDLVIDKELIDTKAYYGLVNTFALAVMAKVMRTAGPTPTNYLTTGPNIETGEYSVNLTTKTVSSGTITLPVGYIPKNSETGTYWKGAIDECYLRGKELAEIYKNAFNKKKSASTSTSKEEAHNYAINTLLKLFKTTAFDNNEFDFKLQERVRLSGNIDNYASRWYKGQFIGSVWNGGIWETGYFEHYTNNGDGINRDWFGRIIETGKNYTYPSAWFRGLWKSGSFSTKEISEKGIIKSISDDRRSYKKCFFMSVNLPIPDDEFSSRYDNRTIHGLSETTIKSNIEYPLGKFPAEYKRSSNNYYLNDISNLASWFTRTKKIDNKEYTDEIERWFAADESNEDWRKNNPHQLDWHYFSEFNGVFISGVFLDLFKKNTYVMDFRGIAQRTPLLSTFAEWGKRPSPALSRKNNIREGVIYGNQKYIWNWGFDFKEEKELTYQFGLNDELSFDEFSKGPFFYPFFISSRTLFRLGPDHINNIEEATSLEKDDLAFENPVVSIVKNITGSYTNSYPEYGEWYLTPGIPCFSFPDFWQNSSGNDQYYSDGNNMKNSIRVYDTKTSLYYFNDDIISDDTGITGVQSLTDNVYLSERKYYYDFFLYNLNREIEIESFRFYIVVASNITIENDVVICNNITSVFTNIVGNVYGIPSFNGKNENSGIYEIINVSGTTVTLKKRYYEIGKIIKANDDSSPIQLRGKFFKITKEGMIEIGSVKPEPKKDDNYLSNNFMLDGLDDQIKITGIFSHPVYLPYGHITGGTQPPYVVSSTYRYPGLTGRIEEDLYFKFKIFPYWFYCSNIWKINEENIHNYGTFKLGPKYLGESRVKIKTIYDWIPTEPSLLWSTFHINVGRMVNNIGWFEDYEYNKILDRPYNYGQEWIGFDENNPPTEVHQTVLHYNFGDGYSWVWPKVLFTDLFDYKLFYHEIDESSVTEDNYKFSVSSSTEPENYISKPLIKRFSFKERGISNLLLKKK